MRILLSIGLLIALTVSSVQAQVQVSGKVIDVETGRSLAFAFVIIHRTQNGVFCDTKGEFKLNARRDDSLLVSLTGYTFAKILLADIPEDSLLNLKIPLKLKPIQLREFQIKAPKTFDQILSDLKKAEDSKISHRESISNAVESPITFLYMQFSREGKAIRKISELRAEDEKQALLKELFTRYMLAHIIDLDDRDMDDFISFSGLKESYNLFDTEYELVVYVKKRFADYKRYRGFE